MARKIPSKIAHTVRYTALTALENVFSGGAYSNLLLNELIKKSGLNEKDSRLLTELVYGTISRKLTLDFYLQPFIRQAKKLEDWVKTLLELSAYQLTYLDKVPPHAVLNEAVEIAKARGNQGTGKFVNGVLRNFLRQERASLDSIADPMERLAVAVSMPRWLIEKLADQLGMAEAKKLGESLLSPSHVSARADTGRISRELAIEKLKAEGLEVEASLVSPFGIIGKKGHLAGSSLFHEGLITIQDESSMLVAPAMEIEGQHQILDACAAPGGKTAHMATFLDEKAGGKITALDIHPRKLALIEENTKRLHVSALVETKQLDARKAVSSFPAGSFDRILVDAPCSGLGLMRRKPDIKYTKRPEDFVNLSRIQLEILESTAPALKKSGILTYSTCTITAEENQQTAEAFLAHHPEFEMIEPRVNDYVRQRVIDKRVEIYPHDFMTDGFFICCMKKR